MITSLLSNRSWASLALLGLSIALVATPLSAKKTPASARVADEEIEDYDSEDESDGKYQTKVETPLIGEYVNFAGLNPVRIRGVGLVVGLSGTGGDPAPSPLRTALVEDLKKRNVQNPNRIISSPDTALVEVWADLPPLMKKGDTLDVYVHIPESAEATSLQGGWLMETYLTETMNVAGRGTLMGHHFARAKGPILLANADPDKATSAELMKGRILGGGTVVRERELSIFLKNDYRGRRMVTLVSEAIGRRFHDYDKHGLMQPMAAGKDDQKIQLRVHPRYEENYRRYLQVIRNMAYREQPVARQVRLNRLKEELMIPEKAEKSALQLEAIGRAAIPALKSGLQAPLFECRIHAAIALAYLGEPDGIAVLAEAAKKEPAFRVFALAALSTVEDGEAHLALRKLMHEPSMETRYGAFHALWVLDKDDPFIRGDLITSMEGKTGFKLHVLETEGESLVHLLTRERPEVVLFGANQKFTTPLFLSAGKHIMITAQPGSQRVSVARFAPDRENERREVSLKVADVIRAAAELDATYPDVVQLLTEASQQHNLEGRFTTDALPEAGRMYERPAPEGGFPSKAVRKTRIGRENQTPNIFPSAPKELKSRENSEELDESDESSSSAMASFPDEGKSTRSKSGGKKSSRRSKEPPGPPAWYQPRAHRFDPAAEPVENSEPEVTVEQAEGTDKNKEQPTKPR